MEIEELQEVERYLVKWSENIIICVDGDLLANWLRKRFVELEARENSRKNAAARVEKL